MNDIIRLLPKLLEAAGDNHEFTESLARVAWTRAVGDGLRAHTIPIRLSGNTLVVAVADAPWQKQLRAMSAELLARVNRVLGQNLIHFLEFRVCPDQLPTRNIDAKEGEQIEPAWARVPVEIVSAAEDISDESLREHFLLAAAAAMNRRQGQSKI